MSVLSRYTCMWTSCCRVVDGRVLGWVMMDDESDGSWMMRVDDDDVEVSECVMMDGQICVVRLGDDMCG